MTELDPDVAYIQQMVADDFRITVELLRSKKRARRYSWPRMLAMHITREALGVSYPWLAIQFGGVHHTSIMHACTWASHCEQYEKYIADTLQKLEGKAYG